MSDLLLSIRIDVDTDRGTRIGVPNLLALFDEFGVKATFLFSLGPNNTGRAIKRGRATGSDQANRLKDRSNNKNNGAIFGLRILFLIG